MNFGKRTLAIIGDTPRFRKRLLKLATERNELLAEQNGLLAEQVTLAKDQAGVAAEQLRVARDQLAFTRALKESGHHRQVAIENIRMAAMSSLRSSVKARVMDRQLRAMETVERIRDERLSFARFGDGEFRLMFRPEFNLRFQKNNPELSEDLKRVFSAPSDGVLLGLPHFYSNPHWSTVVAELWHEIEPLLADVPVFGDAHVSRPPIFKEHGEDAVNLWSSVWAGRDAAVVAGKGSRFELIDPLFGSLSSVERIDSLPTDAHGDLGRVVDLVLQSGRDLALIALGPAGTILADSLARNGIQALDIGHLTASYEHVFHAATDPESRPLKS